MGILSRLAAVMFYAAVPLIIPTLYGYYLGEPIWQALALTVVLLMLPEIPHILMKIAGFLRDFIRGIIDLLLGKEGTPWNYAALVDIAGMRGKLEELSLGEALALTSLAWIVIPLISTLPYFFYGMGPLNAFFESMSGWTSTGLSVIQNPEILPQSLILFRSITQWVGGLGIIILMLTVLRGREARTLLKAEGRESLDVGIVKSVQTYWRVYLALSLLAIMLLFYLGVDLFNAVNLSMSGISNGGFFPFSHYDFSDIQKFALAGIMFAGAISMVFFHNISKGRISKAILDEEFLLYVLVTVTAIGLIAYIGHEDTYNTILNSVSAIACGGFAIGDVAVMHEFSKYGIILLMICGGMYGSTTGALKLWRILVAGKSVLLRIRRAFLPEGAVQVVKVNGIAVGTEAVVESAVFIFAYLALLLFASGVFIAHGKGMVDSLFLVASSLGNVGLSTFAIWSLSTADRGFIIMLMYLGRIEIFPTLALARLLTKSILR